MYAKKTIIRNKTGLHARPASEFVGCANRFLSDIVIRKLSEENGSANAKSIIKLMLLGLGQGEEVEINAEGEDETEAVDTLVALIDSGFDEETD